MFKSIFRRLFWTYAVILMLVFASISASVAVIVDRFAVNAHIDNIIQVADTIAYWTGYFRIENNSSQRARNAYDNILSSWAQFLKSDIIITNKEGEVLAGTNEIAAVPDDYVNYVSGGKILRERSTFNGFYKKKVMVIGVPMEFRGTVVGGMYFTTGIFAIKDTAMNLLYIFMTSSAFSILIAFVLVYLQSRKISRPIRKINSAVQDIASGKFNKRVSVESADEIGQLASSFNFMADSIEKLEESRTEFISDVSHELRTPMTSITGFVEGIMDGTIPSDKQNEYLKIVYDESKRLTKMVNDMLEMTKMSSSEYKLDISEFDLNEVVRICIIGMEQRIDEKNLELNVDFENDALPVLADRDAIKRVVINLLDNAVKFSYSNTTVGIKTWVEGTKAHFCVGNFGDGISGEDMRNIFDRFYKTDKSRMGEKSGAGLGLSFVKNIITLHKQNIWVESVDTKKGSEVKYTKFTFTLELA